MPQSVARKLIFRVGETGFLLDLDRLVEICEQVAEKIDGNYVDAELGIIGALSFRQTQIPVIDPAITLGIETSCPLVDKRALVLKGSEGNWALLVDCVEEIVSIDKLDSCDIPPLLKPAIAAAYSQMSLFAGEPMVHFELDRFYAFGAPS
ncbi:CheW-like domain-containing protein [Malonomonas rubra DSM 5091]|uniref:CheW-like domain-containing protein n=1 Tax=Malonomonas rubra DSM 5091 TaxID=1122189 RepID=A0A1M6BX77_MALRU|nr:chemotaxis protein CheW [Malonomonas rubra]SHI53395.1 CheW-like domain-containing protein [Malonomonas rubra DSM 5091]